jgi:hypothetical protein
MNRSFPRTAASLFVVAAALLTASSLSRAQESKTMDIANVLPLSARELNALAGSQILAAQNGRQLRGPQDDALRIEAVAPGFAGFYLDSNGDLVARLTNMSNQNRADSALRQLIARREVGYFSPLASVRHISFALATFPLSRLIAWQNDLTPLVLRIEGCYSIGVNEQANQLIVGVTPRARGSAARLIRARGVPDAAVSFEVSEAIPMLGSR